MKLISDNRELARNIERCASVSDRISFAVAWATDGTKPYEAIIANKAAIKHGVIGTHFYQTAPKVLEDFVGVGSVRFVLQPSGVFHPKIFLFRSGASWECFIGSANLTNGALTRNAEAVIHLTSEDVDADGVRKDLAATIQAYWSDAKKATAESAAAYRLAWERMKKTRDRLSGGYGSHKPSTSPLESPIMQMEWDEFYTKVRHAGSDHLRHRLELLAATKQAFEATQTFADMDTDTRAMIAGLPNARTDNQGYFGSMKGDGKFHGEVKKDNPLIASAIDRIPLTGAVDRRSYNAFVTDFEAAIPDGRSRPGVASRLLALKRPDTFVCLSARNRAALADDFGIPAGKIDYDTYWDVLVGRIEDSNWWDSPVPTDPTERAVWNGRAAMLDAIFYED